MNNRTIRLVLSAVLIAVVLSGCVQETSEIGAPQSNVTPPAATPDAAQPAPVSEVITASVPAPPEITNWDYVSYRNLSISNAPALNQTARVTYSIVPGRDIEILFVTLAISDGFELVDVEGTWPLTLHNMTFRDVNCARWFPTNLSKDKMYQFNTTIKAVEIGNWTIHASRSKKEIYLSVSEDSACIRDEPFPTLPVMAGESNYTEMWANMTRTSSKPSRSNLTPRPGNVSDAKHFDLWWDGTGWKWVKIQNRS